MKGVWINGTEKKDGQVTTRGLSGTFIATRHQVDSADPNERLIIVLILRKNGRYHRKFVLPDPEDSFLPVHAQGIPEEHFQSEPISADDGPALAQVVTDQELEQLLKNKTQQVLRFPTGDRLPLQKQDLLSQDLPSDWDYNLSEVKFSFDTRKIYLTQSESKLTEERSNLIYAEETGNFCWFDERISSDDSSKVRELKQGQFTPDIDKGSIQFRISAYQCNSCHMLNRKWSKEPDAYFAHGKPFPPNPKK
jgi:hypothetical protein